MLEVVKLALEILQIYVSVKFFRETKKIKEVGTLSRIMVGFAITVTLSQFINDFHLYILEFRSMLNAPVQIHQAIVLIVTVGKYLPLYLNITIMLRFLRVQAQIKAEEENTD